jgi:beta-lactamase class A
MRWALVPALLLLAVPAIAQAPEPPGLAVALGRLQDRLAQIAAVPKGRVGIAAHHLETGRSIAVHGDERFPMASAYKVAIAAAYLAEVEAGRVRLDQMIPVEEALRNEFDGIDAALPHAGAVLSAANLIDLMLRRSDNTATDLLLKAIGGPKTVSSWLRAKGIAGQRVDRDVALLILDNYGVPVDPGSTSAKTLRRIEPPGRWSPPHPVNPAFDADPRDSSTPRAMVALLTRLHKGELLNAPHTAFLWDILDRCETGTRRVKAMLPPGTPWAHKTGTLAGIAADVGVLTLPDGSHVALAVFVRGIFDVPTREAIIAEAGRTLFDGMLLVQ